MTRSEIVSSIQARMGQRTDLASVVQTELQLAQTFLEQSRFLPWFLLDDVYEWSTSLSASGVLDLPPGFLREVDSSGRKGGLQIRDSLGEWKTLQREELEELHEYDNETGQPQIYALTKDSFTVRPFPEETHTARLVQYYKAESLLDSDDDYNNWTVYAPYLLIGLTGKRVASDILRDQNQAAIFDRLYQEALSEIMLATTARQVSGGYYPLG
jgi:hypothetical protein